MLLLAVSPEEGERLLLAVGTEELTLEHLLVLAAQKGTSAIRDFWGVRNGINKGFWQSDLSQAPSFVVFSCVCAVHSPRQSSPRVYASLSSSSSAVRVLSPTSPAFI